MNKLMIIFLTIGAALVHCGWAQENVALNKQVTMLDDPYGWHAQYAVDGDVGTGAHTSNTQEAWLEVDLDGSYSLTQIEIVNRTASGGKYLYRLNNVIVQLLGGNHEILYESDPIADAPAQWTWESGPDGFNLVSYIRCIRTDANPITIMELRAFGVSISAVNGSPSNGAEGILVDHLDTSDLSPTLTWTPNALIDIDSISGYYVYFGSDMAEVQDANSITPDSFMMSGDIITDTSYQHSADLLKDTTYYWRVDVSLKDANTVRGAIWNFTSERTLPNILSQPVGIDKLVGDDASLTVEAVDPLGAGLSYQWYKDPDAAVEGDEIPVTVDSAQSPTLIFRGITDEVAGLYYCELTNATGSIQTDTVEIFVGHMIAYWPFEGNYNEVVKGIECVGVNDPNLANFVPGKVGDLAITLDGATNYVQVPVAAVSDLPNDKFSLSFWFSSTAEGHNQSPYGLANTTGGREIQCHLPWGNNVYVDAGGRSNWTAGSWALDGQWHQFIVTVDAHKDGGFRKVYIDGVLWHAAYNTTNEMQDIGVIALGANPTNGTSGDADNFYQGQLDDFRIYDIALDETAIMVERYDATGEYTCLDFPAGDFDENCRVDLEDFRLMIADWLTCHRYPEASCP